MNTDQPAIVNDIQSVQVQHQYKRRKKCHGNRKDQRFRQRCRAQGMDEITIEDLLRQRKHSENANPTDPTSNRNNTTDPNIPMIVQ